MRDALVRLLRQRYGPRVAKRLRGLPGGWTSSARRRRFLFLALCAPGFVGVAAFPFHKNLAVLGVSLGLALLAWIVRLISEPQFVAGDLPHA